MILTGKTKAHFEKFLHDYLIDNDLQIDRDFFPNSLWNTIIFEFFDSIGIIVNIYYNTYSNGFVQELILNDKILNTDNNYKTRQEATTEAIKKANYLYNERKI